MDKQAIKDKTQMISRIDSHISELNGEIEKIKTTKVATGTYEYKVFTESNYSCGTRTISVNLPTSEVLGVLSDEVSKYMKKREDLVEDINRELRVK